ncbi:MAG: hypothetical protein QNJ70_26695 [Xenococcaceae cyanobacterium MO_207.B15]|nr:hypothetical protein [Xenococcaceae cyanobacterium MO_207.B15]
MNKISLKLLVIVPLVTNVLAIPANARELVFTAPEAPRETGSTNSRFNLLSKELSQFTDEINLDFFNLTT